MAYRIFTYIKVRVGGGGGGTGCMFIGIRVGGRGVSLYLSLLQLLLGLFDRRFRRT